jgi:hypothetical protein
MSKDPRLIQLQAACAAESISKVAAKLGIPRPTLSIVVNEKYPANPENILRRFDEVWNGIDCPHLHKQLTRDECNAFSDRPRPNQPLGLQHWRACQHCEHNLKKEVRP